MDTQLIKKVYVAVGNDLQEGLESLDWALRNWSSQSISIVILHFNNISKDFVYTPFGKLPVSSLSDAKLKVLKMREKEKTEKLLYKYIAFCGKVRAEVVKIEQSKELIHKVLVEVISKLRITKLVMGITFMKSLSWNSKSWISGLFYVHKNKPDFCEMFIIYETKLVLLREDKGKSKEEIVENDQNIMVTKSRDKGSFMGWLGKVFTDSSGLNNVGVAPTTDSRDWWETYVQEINSYFQWLSVSNLEESSEQEVGNGTVMGIMGSNSSNKLGRTNYNVNVSNKVEALRAKLKEAQKQIQENKEEIKASVDRKGKAEWIISLCDRRVEELEKCTNIEITDQNDLKRSIEVANEDVQEVLTEIKEIENKLKTVLELQSEVAKKLNCSAATKSRCEGLLEKAVTERDEVIQDIEKFRRQKDVFWRRIEFCRENEAILATGSTAIVSNSYRDFTFDEIRKATNDFSEGLRLKCGGVGTSVYRGRLNHTSIAIKFHTPMNSIPFDEFHAKMEFLSQIRHPHIIAMIGACSDHKCIVYEYMNNGSLQEFLLPCRPHPRIKRTALSWASRIRIAAQISSGLSFLHSAKPKPIYHGNLNLANILLDHNLVPKITNVKLDQCQHEPELDADVSNFGILMLGLLTGREKVGLVEEVTKAMECGTLTEVMDESAKDWPLDLAEEFTRLALRCVQATGECSVELRAPTVTNEIEYIRKKAEVVQVQVQVQVQGDAYRQGQNEDVQSNFLCLISKEIMKNPHVAADGFSYELKAIAEWFKTGHNTSPTTNQKLENKILIPNHSLRALINHRLHRQS